jgi:hypothetical protein
MGTELFISHQLSLGVAVKHKRVVDYPPLELKYLIEPVYYKWQKEYLTSYWFVEKGTSEGSEWYQIYSR